MSYAGIGSIIIGAKSKTFVLKDTSYWDDESMQELPYVTRVTKALKLGDIKLKMPPVATLKNKNEIDGKSLPAILFPKYCSCKKCGLLHYKPWSKDDKNLICKCGGILEQVAWCAISDDGSLDDVPWHFIAHYGSYNECKMRLDESYLKIDKDGFGKQVVHCLKCGATHTFANFSAFKLSKKQPWLKSQDDFLPSIPSKNQRVVEINSLSVCIPQSQNALVIPPESRIKKADLVDKLYNNSLALQRLQNAKSSFGQESILKELTNKYFCSINDIKNALEKIKQGYPFYGKQITISTLKQDEYKAFLTPISDVSDDEDFVTKHNSKEFKSIKTNDSFLDSIVKVVDNLVAVKRLREIQVFEGFYRHSAENKEALVSPNLKGDDAWLPAIELFGEGIFFSLDEGIIKKWENDKEVLKRAQIFKERFMHSNVHLQNEDSLILDARFLLLHTLAHLLIKELEALAGYQAASLKEHIYSSSSMCGILIYTAVADVAGSLGGILQNAEPREFLALMGSAFRHANWCSMDPVCINMDASGPNGLNMAACHACALLPEPSCECANLLLDRSFLSGNEKMPNFLDFVNKVK